MDENMSRSIEGSFGAMVKPRGAACNLDCDYCYYLDRKDLYAGKSDFRMDNGTLETFTKQYIQSQSSEVITFLWHGGEPLLRGIPFYRRAIELQQKYVPAGKVVENSIQTNGTLVNEAWANFFAENDFLVGVSIDGPASLHDHYRKTKTNEPSHAEVMRGFRLLKQKGVNCNILTVVNDVNVQYPLEVYRFLKEIGTDQIQFIPLVEPKDGDRPGDVIEENSDRFPVGTPAEPVAYGWAENYNSFDHESKGKINRTVAAGEEKVTDFSVHPTDYYEFLAAIFDEWVRNDIGDISIQVFEEFIRAWIGDGANLCVFQETCGTQLAVEHNGDVYSCDHFVDEENYLGNVSETSIGELVTSPAQQKFGADKRDTLPSYCRECEYQFACHGGCPKNRIIDSPDGEGELNYLCPGYKQFFSYVDPYMDIIKEVMDQDAPIHRVRDLIAQVDERF